ncbi:MAG: cache domain-containing protein, partial [Caulobacteraceae bacterium]
MEYLRYITKSIMNSGVDMKNRSLFIKIFIVLTLFIIIPVITIATILSYQLITYSENEISKSAIGKLKVAENLSELIADTLNKQALEISNSNTLNSLNGMKEYDQVFSNSDDIMNLSRAQDMLLELVRTNNILHSMYLLTDESDYILTSNQGVVKNDDFADTGWMDAYYKYKTTKTGPTWLPTRTFRYSKSNTNGELGTSNKVITYFYTLTPYIARVQGVLVFNIYEESIRKLINSRSSINEGYIEIVNPDGYVISHVQDNLIGSNISSTPYMKEIMRNPAKDGYIIDKTGNGRQLVTFYKSNFCNWIYIGVFSVDSLMAKVNALKMRTIYICLICMFIGTLASYLISKRIYNPLNKLVQDIKSRKGVDIKSNENEMSILSRAFDSLLRQEAKLFYILENNKANIKDACLISLLQGKPKEEFDNDFTGVDFTYSNYVCAVLSIDRYNNFISSYTEQQQEYMRMLILKVSEELLNSM